MEYIFCYKCKGLSASSKMTSNQMESHTRQCLGNDAEDIETASFDYFMCNKADFFALLEIKKSLNRDVCIRLKNRDTAAEINMPNNVIESLLKLSISKTADVPKQNCLLISPARSSQKVFTADQHNADSEITRFSLSESSKSTISSSLPSPSSCQVETPFNILTEEETAKLNECGTIKHGNCEKFVCKLCNYQTKSSKFMLRHLNSHNNGEAFQCEHCGFTTTIRVKWNDHHCKYQGGKLLCHLCPERFNAQSKLDHHLAVVHSEEVTNQATQHLQCNSCDYIARYPGSLKEHQRKHTGESLTCPHDNCNFKSLYNRSLQKHLQQKHSKEKNQICDICGFQTRHSSSLKKHMILHKSRDSKQTYKCAECSFSDSSPSQLLHHVQRKHLKVISHSCSKCPFKTSYQEAMKKHMVRHARIEADEAKGIKSSKTRKLRYYFCSVCGEVLNNMKAAKEHVQKFHSTEGFQIVSDDAMSKTEEEKSKDQSVSVPSAFGDKNMNFDNLLDVDISNDVLDIASNILSNEVSEKDTYAPDNVAMSITDEPMCDDVFHSEEANSSVSTKGGNPMLSATNDVLTDIDSTLIEDSLFDLMLDFPRPPTLNRCQSASTLMFASLTQHMVDRPLTPDFFTDSPAQSFFQNFPSRSMDQDNFTVSSLNQPFQMSTGFPSQIDLTVPARANKPPSPVLTNFTCFPTISSTAQTSLNLVSSVDTETTMAECLLQPDSM